MGLTYDGIIHRSLEEQVRYDAEQVQLLKQADVTINENLQTINENLQTINTEISGKLTKPSNPSAESAVTMLADGTVVTKPLSEFGGKVYLHRLILSARSTNKFSNISAELLVYSTTPISFIEQPPNGAIYGVANIYWKRYSDGQLFLGTSIISTTGIYFKGNTIDELVGGYVLGGASSSSTSVLYVTETFKNVTFTDAVYDL